MDFPDSRGGPLRGPFAVGLVVMLAGLALGAAALAAALATDSRELAARDTSIFKTCAL
jgi:hypothetical protein